MNRENVLRVADAIEKHSIPDLGFNMGMWIDRRAERDHSGHDCGTTACIAGWAYSVEMDGVPSRGVLSTDIRDRAQEFFGLSWFAAERLFVTGWTNDGITSKQAVAVLRHLAETGEVDWSVADKVAAE